MMHLFVWAIIGMAGTSHTVHKTYGWVNYGEFESQKACDTAIQQLALDPKSARCVAKGDK